jgi:hypothetical protein
MFVILSLTIFITIFSLMRIHIFNSKQDVTSPDLIDCSRIAFIVETTTTKQIHIIIVGAEISNNKFVTKSTTIRTSARGLVIIVTLMVTTAEGVSNLSIGAMPIVTDPDSYILVLVSSSKHNRIIQGNNNNSNSHPTCLVGHLHRLLVWLSSLQEFSVIHIHHYNRSNP